MNVAKWLGLFLGFFVIGGIVSGAVAWLSNRGVEEEQHQLFDVAEQAYRSRGEAQAVIDTTYQMCSSSWIDATVENDVRAWETLTSFKDANAVRNEVRNHYEKVCLDGDIEAYCEAVGKTMVKWAVDDVGAEADIERGCLSGFRMAMESTFVSECVSAGATEGFCSCAFKHIESTYGLSSVVHEELSYAATGEESALFNEMIDSAVSACPP